MDQEATLREPILTKPCPHCGEPLRLYAVRCSTTGYLPGYKLARPALDPPSDAILVWAQTGMDALNAVLDHDFVAHPTYVCPCTEYRQMVAEQWPTLVGTGGQA